MAHLIGSWLTYLDPSAINTNGVSKSGVKENVTELKAIMINGVLINFATGVFIRRNMRSTGIEIYGDVIKRSEYKKVPGKNVAYNKANPIENSYDDIYGYFIAEKNGTYTRKSPLQVSNMTLLKPSKHLDFRVSAQHEGNPVIYQIELCGGNAIFNTDLDLGRLGVFYNKDISGYKNMNFDEKSELIEHAIKNGAKFYDDKKVLVLPYEERKRRVEYILRPIVYLQGGANMARDYTDISPVLFIFYVGKGAGQSPRWVYKFRRKYNAFIINPETLYEHYEDKRLNIISKIYVGWQPGYPFGYTKVRKHILSVLIDLFGEENIVVGSPNKVIDQFMNDIREDWFNPKLDV